MVTEIKLPPHDNAAEDAVIGSILIDGKQINPLTIDPSDFFQEDAGIIYAACKQMADKAFAVNQITVAQELDRQGKLEKIGGAAYLSQLIANCATPLDCHYYAEIVKQLSVSRGLISVADQIERIGFHPGEDINADVNKADELLLNLRKRGASMAIITPEQRVTKMVDRYNKLHEQADGVAISTGLKDLDYHIGGGLYAGEMAIVAARPSIGKTDMMMSICNHVAKTKNVLVCSAEMTDDAIGDRDIAGILGMTTNQVRRGGYDHDTWARMIGEGVAAIRERRIFPYFDPPMTTAKILQAGINMQLRYGLDMIAVDYLGLLEDQYGKNEVDRLGYISRKIKLTAMKLNVPILLLCQLNRAVEGREDKRPELFDLRGSGHIEEDADLVMFLHRDDYYFTEEEWKQKFDDKPYPLHVTEVILGKQRQGPANLVIRIFYDETHQKYCNLVHE